MLVCDKDAQYPNFSNLLQKLSHNLMDDLSSKTDHSKYESSISILNRERKSFLKNRLIQNICEEYSVSGNDEKHKMVGEAIALSKLEQIININHDGRQIKLANIAPDDLAAFNCSAKMKEIIKPVIEEELGRYKHVIGEFCDNSTQRSPSTIILNNSYNKLKLLKLAGQIECKQSQYIQQAGEALRLFDKVAQQRTTQEEKDRHMERVMSLSAMSSKLNLMVANLEANIVSDTYTADNVSALKVIHTELKDRERALEKDSSHAKHVLSAYLSLGEEFTGLVELFTELKKQLESYKWALNLEKP